MASSKLTLGPRNWAVTLTQIHRAPPHTPNLPVWEVHVVLQREAGSDYSADLMQQAEERKESSCVQTQSMLGVLGWKAYPHPLLRMGKVSHRELTRPGTFS